MPLMPLSFMALYNFVVQGKGTKQIAKVLSWEEFCYPLEQK